MAPDLPPADPDPLATMTILALSAHRLAREEIHVLRGRLNGYRLREFFAERLARSLGDAIRDAIAAGEPLPVARLAPLGRSAATLIDEILKAELEAKGSGRD
jgi:hypothetical protein